MAKDKNIGNKTVSWSKIRSAKARITMGILGDRIPDKERALNWILDDMERVVIPDVNGEPELEPERWDGMG
jgi:hypothetical protein